MTRKSSVHFIQDVGRSIPENLLCEKVRHTVGKVHCNLQIAVVSLVLQKEIQIVAVDVHPVDLSLALCGRSRSVLINPLFDCLQTGIIADCTGVFCRDLHPVVLRSIVRSGNLNRSLEIVIRSREIDCRRRGQSEVIHICPRIGDSLEKTPVNLVG